MTEQHRDGSVPEFHQRLIAGMATIFIAIVLCMAPVRAEQWQRVAAVGDELNQYVDLDSIRASPSLRRVASYFTDARSSDIQRTDYTTLYDCDRRVFKDLSENGQRLTADWSTAADDPLNLETMNFACSLDANELLKRQP